MKDTCNIDSVLLIVNSVAAAAAVIAAIIAVVVYKKSSTLQKKAIGYALFESRIKIWKYFEQDKGEIESLIKRTIDVRDWQEERFKLLFSKDLVSEYDNMNRESGMLDIIRFQIENMESEVSPMRANASLDPTSEEASNYMALKCMRKNVETTTAAGPDWEEFERLCFSVFGENKEKYFATVKEYIDAKNASNARYKAFVQRIEKEIQESIKAC